MKGGRLRIVNESRYSTAEVEQLVKFGLAEIDVKGYGLVAVVQDTRPTKRREHGARDFSGTAWSLYGGVPVKMADKYLTGKRDWYLLFMRLGPPRCFPIEPFTRNGHLHEFATWQEALVAITAHEGMHAQHYHDRAYRFKSGVRRFQGSPNPIQRFRVGSERIEPKCEAFENYMLRLYRDTLAV